MADHQMLPFSSAPLAHCAGFPIQCPGGGSLVPTVTPSGDQESHCRQTRALPPSHYASHSEVWQVVKAPPHSHDRAMLWAAMNTCFFGFLRAGEICAPSASSFDPSWHLCVDDVALDSHTAPSASSI